MNFWQTTPFARIAISFSVGVLGSEYLNNFNLTHLTGCFLSVCLLSLISNISALPMRVQFHLKGLSLIGFLLLLGAGHHFLCDERNYMTYFGQKSGETLLVKISERPEPKKDKLKMKASVIAWFNENQWYRCSGNLLLYIPNTPSLRIEHGDLIQIKRSIVQPPSKMLNPYGFDYSRYLHINGIHHVAFAKNADYRLVGINQIHPMMRWIQNIQNHLLQTFAIYFPDKNDRGIIEALTFGYKVNLEDQAVDIYSKTGVIHVLAVSGLHVGLIYASLRFVTFFLMATPWQRKIRASIIVVGLIAYALLTGMSPSVNRAVLMFILFVLADVSGKNNQSLNSLFSSAFILLLINPLWLFHAGFQLSYLAVAGILLLHPNIEKSLSLKSFWLKKLWTLVSVSLAAQIATFPLCIFLFHQFPNLFLPANLIAIPLTTVLLILGCLLPIFHSLSWLKFLSLGISELADFLLQLNHDVLLKLSELPFALTENLYLTSFETGMLYVIIAAVYGLMVLRFRWGLILFLAAMCSLTISHTIRIQKNMNSRGWVCFIHKNQGIPAYKYGKNLAIFDNGKLETSKAYLPFYQAECGRQIDYFKDLENSKYGLWRISIPNEEEIFIAPKWRKKYAKIIPEHAMIFVLSPIYKIDPSPFSIIVPRVYHKKNTGIEHELTEKGFWSQLHR